MLPPDDQLLEVLRSEHDLQLDRAIELRRDEKAARRSRGGEAVEAEVRVEVETQAGEHAVVLVEEDGVYRWAFPQDARQDGRRFRSRGARDPRRPAVLAFSVDLGGALPGSDRGRIFGGIKKLAEKARVYVFRFAANWVADQGVRFLERGIERGMLDLKAGGTPAEPDPWGRLQSLAGLALPQGRPARVLLLVHGTFSSTAGSYGALCYTSWGRSFLGHAAEHYDAILGFDHPTLSESPGENAIELLRLLKSAPWDAPPRIDAVSFSRGGLVLRSLIEQLIPSDGWAARVDRAVFVGATNAGTQLAEPENWHRFIDFYTNLAVGAARLLGVVATNPEAGRVLGGLLKGVGAFAKTLATTAVSEARIPGLSAMEPDGPFVRAINETQAGQPAPHAIGYYAVTSDFDLRRLEDAPSPGLPKRLLFTFGDRLVDQLLGEANDLVVHTASMTTIDPHVRGFIREVSDFGTNAQVYHTVYFAQPATVQALHKWFELPGAIEVEEGAPERARSARLPDDQSIVFEPVSTTLHDAPSRPPGSPPLPGTWRRRPRLRVTVHWGDLTKVEGDVYAVGHYVGVMPQNAELALDRAISCSEPPAEEDGEQLLLSQLTRRGLLRGDLGHVELFPWRKEPQRLAAICGMGFFGGFREADLRLLYRNLVWELNTMRNERTLCTVLIGSGPGALDARTALRGLLRGAADALVAPTDDGAQAPCAVREVRIVEHYKDKAEEFRDLLHELQPEVELDLELEDEVVAHDSGQVRPEHAVALVAGALLKASQQAEGTKGRKLLEEFLAWGHFGVPGAMIKDLLGKAVKTLQDGADEGVEPPATAGDEEQDAAGEQPARRTRSTGALSRGLEVRFQTSKEDSDIPTRLTFQLRDGVYRVAALTATAATPEREIGIDPSLVTELIERLEAPEADEAQRLGRLLYRLLIPHEFRDLLRSDLVIEVDRDTAPVPWELLCVPEGQWGGDFLSVEHQVSRQLRTTYSGAPIRRSRYGRRALVVGDPGDPVRGEDLPGARDEALLVVGLLKQYGFHVDTFIGAPSQNGGGLTAHPPAGRLDVLDSLLHGRYEIVHYAGHADYDRADPSRTGWLFAGGKLLTARELERMDEAPSLIVANACLSGRTSQALGGEGDEARAAVRRGKPYGELGLLPSLADEVFRRGVRNYVGTAWEVNDQGALLFARQFYERFLGGRVPIGEALQEARAALWRHREQYGTLWAAYQHYGDPAFSIDDL